MYNILICDDQPDIVNALKIYLSPEGYGLFEAFNGADAVKIAKENDIHLILLDVMMPGMDGITATSKIREFSNVPIILLTAKSETEDKVLGLNVGADDYITGGGAGHGQEPAAQIFQPGQPHGGLRHPDPGGHHSG